MLRYDHHPSRQRDAIAQREAILAAIVDYRYLAPAKIAADELCEREMARVALSPAPGRSAVASRLWMASLRHRLGAALIAAGTRLQRNTAAGLDPQLEA